MCSYHQLLIDMGVCRCNFANCRVLKQTTPLLSNQNSPFVSRVQFTYIIALLRMCSDLFVNVMAAHEAVLFRYSLFTEFKQFHVYHCYNYTKLE